MSNEHSLSSGRPDPVGSPPGSARALAFERLIDQIAPGAGHVPPAVRSARRLCGRWLLMRRTARQLSYAQVAERTGLSEGAVELIEQGLLGPTPGPEEVWQRLGLVLERHPQNDLQRVAAAIAIARGSATTFDATLLASFEAEITVPEEEAGPAPRPLAEIAEELLDILLATKSVGSKVTAYQVKKAIAEAGGKSWNPADLPRAMATLAGDGLLSRSEGRPASYALTEAGAEIVALAEQRERAREAARHAQEALASLDHRINAVAGRLTPLPG